MSELPCVSHQPKYAPANIAAMPIASLGMNMLSVDIRFPLS